MAYKVILEATAKEDAREYAAFLLESAQAHEPARKWLDGLEHATQSLAEMPRRYRVIDEQDQFGIELRQFVYYSHRVIYHVNDDTGTVHVLRIYHGHRDELDSIDPPR